MSNDTGESVLDHEYSDNIEGIDKSCEEEDGEMD
jgi:hypothetical protein